MAIFFTFKLHAHLQLGFIVANQVEKMPCGVQFGLRNHLPNGRNNYIFIYFGMPLKMDDMSVLFIFIFIQIDINHKFKLHMQLQHFVVVYAITRHFLLNAMEGNCIYSHKNGWFGHKSLRQIYKSQTKLEWTWFLVVY